MLLGFLIYMNRSGVVVASLISTHQNFTKDIPRVFCQFENRRRSEAEFERREINEIIIKKCVVIGNTYLCVRNFNFIEYIDYSI